MNTLLTALVDWSRLQFALTAMFHWCFVPLTLGLGILVAIMETIYVRTGNEFWKRTVKFWMKLFGINFAIGVATGLILEFEFGTNWSNYSWFVGDIFGAPLAIEGIFAFFLETTFLAVMFFGWNKVGKGFHLLSTWLVAIGTNLSALWILIANSWMQYPAGMYFNPETARNEMVDIWAVVFSPVAMNKFTHTVFSGFTLAAVFMIGVSAWYLIKKRDQEFAIRSTKLAALFGLVSALLLVYTGDGSAVQVAQKQPMKLAAMEGLYRGGNGVAITGIGVLKCDKKPMDGKDPMWFNLSVPKGLSWLATGNINGYVAGIEDIIEGNFQYVDRNGQQRQGLPMKERMTRGKLAIAALGDYQQAKKQSDTEAMLEAKTVLEENFDHFGYGYLNKPEEAVPHIGLTFYTFHLMVLLGGFIILVLIGSLWWSYRGRLEKQRWFLYVSMWSILLVYIASQAGWIVAEVGRQPWTIQDLLPASAAVSGVSAGTVQTTFFIFLTLIGTLLIAEISIMIKQINKGPEKS
ncbi:MAG: cytochrome ubiquinol oxidase subunit I [Bacteroidetes bacterium]|nr:cytochrome ubiquinol oxidase subunit I [Bacteroidota bacterium]